VIADVGDDERNINKPQITADYRRLRVGMKGDHRDEQTYVVIGAAMGVHREPGPGFLEAVYQEAPAIELALRGIPFERERLLPVRYQGRLLASIYRADFVCYGEIIVETKALDAFAGIHVAQTINYLRNLRTKEPA
jgi:GxxExxY protein